MLKNDKEYTKKHIIDKAVLHYLVVMITSLWLVAASV